MFFVYILSSSTQTLYIGVTNDLSARLVQHRSSGRDTFAGRYEVWKLVYAETYGDPVTAITREKQLKHWSRAKKLWLIGRVNPHFNEIEAA
jgi:putative endonuclease